MTLKEGKKEETLETLAKASALLNRTYHNKSRGENLQLLSPVIKSLAMVMTARTMEEGNAPLFLGISQGLLGIYASESITGFVGKTLQKVIQSLTEGLLSPIVWEPAPGESNKLLFRNMIAMALIVSAILGSVLAGKENNNASEKSEQTRNLISQMALLFIGESNVLTATYKCFLQACGASEKSKEPIAEILSLCSLLLMVLAVARKGKQDIGKILETIKPAVVRNLTKVEQVLNDALTAHTVTGGHGSALLVAVQQCKLAFEKEDASGVVEAIKGALEVIEESLDELNKDLKEIQNVADLFYTTFTTGLDDKTNIDTGIAVVA